MRFVEAGWRPGVQQQHVNIAAHAHANEDCCQDAIFLFGWRLRSQALHVVTPGSWLCSDSPQAFHKAGKSSQSQIFFAAHAPGVVWQHVHALVPGPFQERKQMLTFTQATVSCFCTLCADMSTAIPDTLRPSITRGSETFQLMTLAFEFSASG